MTTKKITAQDVKTAEHAPTSPKTKNEFYITLEGWGDCKASYYNEKGFPATRESASGVVLSKIAGGFEVDEDMSEIKL